MKEGVRMKWTEKIKPRIEGLIQSVGRFPVTTFFLLGITLMDIWMIENSRLKLDKWVAAFVAGAFLSALAQIVYERFSSSSVFRWSAYALSLGVTIVFYLFFNHYGLDYLPLAVRTGIFLSVVFLAFFWVPSYRTKITFHRNFLAGSKAFFLSWLYSIVIAIGTSSLLFAVDRLLFPVRFESYLHMWNITFVLLESLFFLSFIPNYTHLLQPNPQAKLQENSTVEEERIEHETAVEDLQVPRSLEILLTYIVMPLLSVYTLVLISYFLKNIRGVFWADALLEPLMLSYSIIGLYIFILVCNLKNKFALLFINLFPKVLIPVMGFQLFSSFMRMKEIGLTHGRYFVLLTVLTTLVSGILLSFRPTGKTGLVALLFMLAGIIAIVPPTDGFSTARRYHISKTNALIEKNGLLKDGKIEPNPEMPSSDKKKIAKYVSYLERIGGLSKVQGISRAKLQGNAFEETFGFSRNAAYYEEEGALEEDQDGIDYSDSTEEYAYLIPQDMLSFEVTAFDYLIHFEEYYNSYDELAQKTGRFSIGEETYEVSLEADEEKQTFLFVRDASQAELAEIELKPLYQEVLEKADSRDQVSLEDATVDIENERTSIQLIFDSVSFFNGNYSTDFYVLVKIK